jgi:hypothetical protein
MQDKLAERLSRGANSVPALVVVLLAGSPALAQAAPVEPADVRVHDVTVIDVLRGQHLTHRDISLRDGQIVAIEKSVGEPNPEARGTIGENLPSPDCGTCTFTSAAEKN